MIVVKVSMVIHRGKREEAIRLLRERDKILEKEGVPKAARMYVRKLASAGSPEIIREYEFSNFAEYESAWAKRMRPTDDSRKWAAQFDSLVVPGTMGYEVYDLVES
jgi:RES domain-containing protein